MEAKRHRSGPWKPPPDILPDLNPNVKWPIPVPTHPIGDKILVPFINKQKHSKWKRQMLGAVKFKLVPLMGDPLRPDVWTTGVITVYHSPHEFESELYYFCHYRGEMNPFDPDGTAPKAPYLHSKRKRAILKLKEELGL